jgi:hypothetical protein
LLEYLEREVSKYRSTLPKVLIACSTNDADPISKYSFFYIYGDDIIHYRFTQGEDTEPIRTLEHIQWEEKALEIHQVYLRAMQIPLLSSLKTEVIRLSLSSSV